MDGFFSFLWMIIQTLIALAIVCGLAFLLFRVILPRFGSFSSEGKFVRLIERVPIESGKSICVVKAGNKFFLVGISEGSMNTLSELEESEVKQYLSLESEEQVLGEAKFSQKLSEAFSRSEGEK